MRESIHDIEHACEAAIAGLSFRRVKRGILTCAMSEDFLGWVGLNVGFHNDFVRINPFVGVHCVPIMRLCRAIEGMPYRKGEIATYAVHLGELCPNTDAFEFWKGGSSVAEAARLALVIKEHAIPYMSRHTTYDSIIPLLERRAPSLGGYPQRLAAAYFLSGQTSKAREFVTRWRSDYLHGGTSDVTAALEHFTIPFLNFLDGKNRGTT